MNKKLNLRFIKSGSIEVTSPDNWDDLSETEKIAWAEDKIAEKSDQELLNALIDYDVKDISRDELFDDSPCVEAIEDVENGYSLTYLSNLWKAYLNY